MIDQITQPEWVSIKQETRHELRKIFMIPRSGSAITENDAMGKGHVISDGCTNSDLQALTTEKLIDYLGGAAVNDNVHTLLKEVVEKIEGIEVVKPVVPTNFPVSGKMKCEKCLFETASKFAMKMHVGKKHK